MVQSVFSALQLTLGLKKSELEGRPLSRCRRQGCTMVAIFCCGPMSLCRPCIHSIDNDCTVNCWWLHPWPRTGWWRGCIIKQLRAMRLLQRLMFLPCRWIRKMRTVVVDRTVKFKLFFHLPCFLVLAMIYDKFIMVFIFFWIFLDLLKLCNFALHELV